MQHDDHGYVVEPYEICDLYIRYKMKPSFNWFFGSFIRVGFVKQKWLWKSKKATPEHSFRCCEYPEMENHV